jgi:hypothetical protein
MPFCFPSVGAARSMTKSPFCFYAVAPFDSARKRAPERALSVGSGGCGIAASDALLGEESQLCRFDSCQGGAAKQRLKPLEMVK